MDKIFFFNDYLEQKYHHKFYRIPIDLALGCPNREDRFGAGCSFCAENGSRARHLSRNLKIPDQVAAGLRFIHNRYSTDCMYIAYFQSFTSTYAPVNKLRELYDEVLKCADFKVVIIATRCDALPDDVIEYLAELNQKYELWVELGVQSAQDATAAIVNRGHNFARVQEAVLKLTAVKINVAAHLIIGLPGEDTTHFLDTAQKVAALPFRAVKFHQLMILKNTPLARSYNENPSFVTPMNEYLYTVNLIKMLKLLPENMMVMRLVGDAPEDQIIAPKWWMKKGQFLEFFAKEWENPSLFPASRTADGSFTLYHPLYRQHFHSLSGAASEAKEKFVAASTLQKHAAIFDSVRILDIGFGLGGNSFATLNALEATQCSVKITAIETDKRVIEAALAIYPANSRETQILKTLLEFSSCKFANVEINLKIEDARKTIRQLDENSFYNYIWLDGFSTDRNPELWSYDFFKQLFAHLAPTGELVTYSAAYPVRGAMLRLGMHVGETPAVGRKKGGTIASALAGNIQNPLSKKELNIIRKSTAGVPFRDVSLEGNREQILSQHRKVIERLRKAGIPKWYKDTN